MGAWLGAARAPWKRYGLALLLTAAAYALQVLIWEHLPPSPYLLFYPAVFVSAWWLGRRPALAAIALSSVAIVYGFLEPHGSFQIPPIADAVDLTLYALVSGVATLALDRLRESLRTEREARRNAEAANRAKDEILAIVSHDLRNPLSAIALTAQSLARDPEARVAHEAAARIDRAVGHATELVNDILAFARVDSGELEFDIGSHPVSKLIEEAHESASARADARDIQLVATPVDATVQCDPERLQQILSNLIANALKFTPAGGTVTLRAERLGDRIGFEVRDTGPGIAPELRDKIFDRYFTADRSRGAGLGLHIARMLVHAQQGEIGVDSEPGKGSTFWFTLPATPTQCARPSQAAAAAIVDEPSTAGGWPHRLAAR